MPNLDVLDKQDYEELLDRCLDLQEYVHHLQDKFEEFSENFSGILDVSDFKYYLELDGLLTSELNDAIDVYMKYYNKEVQIDYDI